MILPYQSIIKLIDEEIVEGASIEAVQAASLDLHMSDDAPLFHVGEGHGWSAWSDQHHLEPINPNTKSAPMTAPRPLAGEVGAVWYLPPMTMCLVATRERLNLHAGLGAQVSGASTLARNGLIVHLTAGWCDPGFSGHVTMELFNTRRCPIMLTPGMRIGQALFMRLTEHTDRPYSGRYAGSIGVQQPKDKR